MGKDIEDVWGGEWIMYIANHPYGFDYWSEALCGLAGLDEVKSRDS
jgi:hypothetical protein